MPAGGRRVLSPFPYERARSYGKGLAHRRRAPSTATACIIAESARLTLIGDMSDGSALGRLRIHDLFVPSDGLTGMERRLLGLADLCL